MQSEIDLAELEAIKAKVERSLPSDVLTDMRRANVSLTLGSSSHGSFRPVVVDAGFAEEVAERELVEEMVSYRKNVTGLDHTVFISPRGHVQHAARIKLAIDPPDTVDPRGRTASIAIHDGTVMAGDSVPPDLLRRVQQFIKLNHAALLEYWEYSIDTEQLRQRLKSV